MKKNCLLLSFALVSSVFAANDFYVGVGVGVSNKFDKFGVHEKELFDGYTNHLMSQVPSGASYTSSKKMSSSNKMMYDLYAGMNVTKNWSAELGYTQFMGNKSHGDFDYKDNYYGQNVNFSAAHKASVISLSAVGELPLNQTFSLTGRAGLGYVRSKQTGHAHFSGDHLIAPIDRPLDSSVSKIQPVLGVGFKANLSKNFALGSEYVYMGKVKNTLVDSFDKEFSTRQSLHKFNILKATYSF